MTGSVKAEHLGALLLSVVALLKPPERLEVHEAAARYVHLENPPVYSGPYDNDQTPYMVEPMNMTQSRDHTALIFVGPAQSGKTEAIVLNVLAYSIKCNPLDIILYHMSQTAAGDFSERRVGRLHRNSKAIGAELAGGQHSDNTYRKLYKSGMMFTISWPSINEMSSKPVPVVMFTDYDRMPEDVGGEGSPFTLGKKRTQTFRNFGMTIVDTSPGHPVEDAKEVLKGHQAPKCKGALDLYNQGNRCRWHWPCPYCGEFFEPSFKLLVYDVHAPEDESGERRRLSDLEIEQSTFMACPVSGCRIEHHHKKSMNKLGVWLAEGEKITKEGVRYGIARQSRTASYWLKGPAANFVTWGELAVKYTNALESYENTGDDKVLKAVTNTDLGEPYVPKSLEQARNASDLMDMATGRPLKVVPLDGRVLIATIDVQKNAFVVQVHAIRPATDKEGDYVDGAYDIAVIDRFNIHKSERLDDEGERLWVKPATHSEDWKLIVSQVMEKRYDLEGGNGTMGISLTLCDSGGKAGVTSKAYNFYRTTIVTEGLQSKFILIKGEPKPNAPRVALEYPDTQRKDRLAQARGEIPILFFNSNILKDFLNGMLDQTRKGGGMIEFPAGLDAKFYEELVAEVRTSKGWDNPSRRRNESWDLLTYCIGALIYRRIEHVTWSKPPTWLARWEQNPAVQLEAAAATQVDKPKGLAHRARNLAAELAS